MLRFFFCVSEKMFRYVCQFKVSDINPSFSEFLGNRLVKTPVRVELSYDSHSSTYSDYDKYWGPLQALTEVSTTWSGYWHSKTGDVTPWIKFEFTESKITSVELTNRLDPRYYERFDNVEVIISGSGQEFLCGKLPFHDQPDQIYR